MLQNCLQATSCRLQIVKTKRSLTYETLQTQQREPQAGYFASPALGWQEDAVMTKPDLETTSFPILGVFL